MQQAVDGVFQRIRREISESGGDWLEVDATLSKDDLAERFWQIVEPMLNGLDDPISRLWTH